MAAILKVALCTAIVATALPMILNRLPGTVKERAAMVPGVKTLMALEQFGVVDIMLAMFLVSLAGSAIASGAFSVRFEGGPQALQGAGGFLGGLIPGL